MVRGDARLLTGKELGWLKYCGAGCDPPTSGVPTGDETGSEWLPAGGLCRRCQPPISGLRETVPNPMPISVPNYRCNTDRFQFGIVIAITSEG